MIKEDKLKDTIKKISTLCSLLILNIFLSASAFSEQSIEKEYKNKVHAYNHAISTNAYDVAYEQAELLLSLDPSDTMSLLRLVYSSKMLNKYDVDVIDSFTKSVARATRQDKEVLAFIKAIQTSIQVNTSD